VQPSLILNEYAAIPSFHFGWIALASAAVWINTSSRTLRVLAVLLTVLMTWAIVASANHFFFDMALGGIVILGSWQVAKRLEAGRTRRRAAEPLPRGNSRFSIADFRQMALVERCAGLWWVPGESEIVNRKS
jgi:hypothetical protein